MIYHAKAMKNEGRQSSMVTKRLRGLIWIASLTGEKNPPAVMALVGITIVTVDVSKAL